METDINDYESKNILYNNLKKKPHTILSSPGFWTGCVCAGKLVGKDPKGENEEISSLIESLMDTVFLLSMANGDINEYRRNNIKSDLRTYA